jgi:microsomal dipeptidase-like Zn-dependent dipeptidase
MLVDLAHSSAATIADVVALARNPPVVSHTGVRATCDNPRNLSDDQIRAIARAGGVIGIGFWETAVCGLEPAAIARAVRYVVDLTGDEHVALGSDFDGAVTTGFDASGVPAITQALLDAGLADDSIRKVLGGNALRVLRRVLPGS